MFSNSFSVLSGLTDAVDSSRELSRKFIVLGVRWGKLVRIYCMLLLGLEIYGGAWYFSLFRSIKTVKNGGAWYLPIQG